jgi:hypothetical protein
VAALTLGAALAAAAEPTSPLDDPFGDGISAGDPIPAWQSRQAPDIAPYTRRYAAGADDTINDLNQSRPRWQPFRWVSQELNSWFTPANPPPPPLVLSVVDAPAQASSPNTVPVVVPQVIGDVSVVDTVRNNNLWLQYPVYLEKFAGAFLANEPIENQLHNGIGFMAGLRTGWDYAEHWGVESRIAIARTSLGGPSLPTEAHENFVIWDAMWLWYPVASGNWRPFLLAGPGMTFVSFIDDHGQRLDQSFFHIPIGIGIKHRFGKQHAFRFDVVDNLLFDQLYPRQVEHQLSFVGGFEWRFGNPMPW